MANPLKGEVEFAAGDKSHTIRLSTDALCGLEAQLGIGFGDIVNRLQLTNFGVLRLAVRAGLGPKATLAEASAIIDAIGYPATLNHVLEAFRLAFPEPEEGENPPTGEAAGTGAS